jgi:competence protein ComEC
LTHEHSDHVGGTLEILKKFKVGKLLVPSESLDSSELQPIVAELKREDIPLELLVNDYRVQFDQFSSLYLITDHGSGANEHSLVGILSNGAARALLMADAGIEAEQRLLKNKNILPVELLKVGHHGSDTASSEEFLRATQAKEAVISVGKNNSYHLPSGRVVSRLRRYGLKIARTDEQGDLVYRPIGTDWQLAP